MKKLLLSLALLPLFLLSCTNTPDWSGEDGKGSIKLRPEINTNVSLVGRATSTDYTTYTVILTGPSGTDTLSFPTGGQIADLDPGSYAVTVSSHPRGFRGPAFDEQVYEGTTTVQVEAGRTVSADISCVQINAGVYFVYDPSLEDDGLSGIVPTVAHETGMLVYENANRDARGYFNPGQAVVTLENEGEPVLINGQSGATLTLEARKLWKITLTGSEVTVGGINITVEVEVIDTVTNEETWTVGGGDPDAPTVVLNNLYATYESWGLNNSMSNRYLLVFTSDDYNESGSGTMISIDTYGLVTGFTEGIAEAYEGLTETEYYKAYTFGTPNAFDRNKIQATEDTKFFHAGHFGDQVVVMTDARIEVKLNRETRMFIISGWVSDGDEAVLNFSYEGPIEFGKATIHLADLNRIFVGYDWPHYNTRTSEDTDAWFFQMHNMYIQSGMFVNCPGDVLMLSLTIPYVEGNGAYSADIPNGTYEMDADGNEAFKIVELNDPDQQWVNKVIFVDSSSDMDQHDIVDGEITFTRSGTGTSARYSFEGSFIIDSGIEVVVKATNRPSNVIGGFWGDSDMTADIDLTDKLVNWDYYIYSGTYGPDDNVYSRYLWLATENMEFEWGYGEWDPDNYTRNDHVVLLSFNTLAYAGIAHPGTYKIDPYWVDDDNYLGWDWLPFTLEWCGWPGVWGSQYMRADHGVIGPIWGYYTDEGYVNVSHDTITDIWDIEFELFDDIPRKRPNMIKGNYSGTIDIPAGEFSMFGAYKAAQSMRNTDREKIREEVRKAKRDAIVTSKSYVEIMK